MKWVYSFRMTTLGRQRKKKTQLLDRAVMKCTNGDNSDQLLDTLSSRGFHGDALCSCTYKKCQKFNWKRLLDATSRISQRCGRRGVKHCLMLQQALRLKYTHALRGWTSMCLVLTGWLTKGQPYYRVYFGFYTFCQAPWKNPNFKVKESKVKAILDVMCCNSQNELWLETFVVYIPIVHTGVMVPGCNCHPL